MRRGRRLWLTVLLCAGAASAVLLADVDDVKVTPIVAGGRVFASFADPAVYTTDAGDVVRSGLPVSFAFVVDLKRPLTLWFDRTIDTVTVVSSVKLDTLTGAYQVSKQRDDKVIWSDRTPREDQMRTWVTSFDRVSLDAAEPLEANAEYYVQVHVRTSPRRGAFLFWPWSRDDGAGRADFTFVR